MAQAFFEDMLSQGAFARKDAASAGNHSEAELVRGGGGRRDRRCQEGPRDDSFRERGNLCLMAGEDPDPPTPSEASRQIAEELAPELERLTLVAEK